MQSRRQSILLAIALFAAWPSNLYAAEKEAEEFIQTNATSALGMLNDSKMSDAERAKNFSAVMNNIADVPSISRFVLGRYISRFDPSSFADYQIAFRDYTNAAYQRQLNKYRGEVVKMLGSLELKPGDVVVKTTLISKERKEDMPVNWRVKKTTAGWKIIDVELFGVWLAIEQQADFATVLDQASGGPNQLIAYIRQKTVNILAGKSPLNIKPHLS